MRQERALRLKRLAPSRRRSCRRSRTMAQRSAFSALIDATLGRKDLALDEGRRAIALMPVEKDFVNGSLVLQYFAITAAWAGEKELALQQLEARVRGPVEGIMLSYGALKLLPFWAPLRG